jgi:hypothetical protein
MPVEFFLSICNQFDSLQRWLLETVGVPNSIQTALCPWSCFGNTRSSLATPVYAISPWTWGSYHFKYCTRLFEFQKTLRIFGNFSWIYLRIFRDFVATFRDFFKDFRWFFKDFFRRVRDFLEWYAPRMNSPPLRWPRPYMASFCEPPRNWRHQYAP